MDKRKSQNSSSIPSQVISNFQNNSQPNIQRIENNVQVKILEMYIQMEQSSDLYNSNIETKNHFQNIRKKLLLTSVVNRNSNLYNKILQLNKQKKKKTK